MKLYAELADWWPLMSPPDDYAEEADTIAGLLAPSPGPEPPRLLELGSGGGHLASHLKARFTMVLADLSSLMLDLSRRLNPECRHVEGDMRRLRLDETFDAVLIFDALSHLCTMADLEAALVTARVHLRPGGVAVFCPDGTAETFQPDVSTGGTDGAGRAMRYMEWTRLTADGSATETDFVYLLREGDGPTRVEVDHVRLGLFSRAQWGAAIARAGFETVDRHTVSARDVFVARVAETPA